jgi:DNA modification methylase
VIASIHPFPARMAPELALQALEIVPERGVVVDPMVGSGTVVRQAVDLGCHAIGFDMDPLAVLMSRAWTTPAPDDCIRTVYEQARTVALAADPTEVRLPWIDEDDETRRFVEYWFGKPQANALRCWAWALISFSAVASTSEEAAALDVIRIALSRIIVTKEQCASLARDTSHSRPHKVTTASDYCVHRGLDRSLKTVRKRLLATPPKSSADVRLGDARNLTLAANSADAILTSPPYLNAIDYMRGHRLSLVWLGHSLPSLRDIRAKSIGAERALSSHEPIHEEVKAAFGDLSELSSRHQGMVNRYVADVLEMAREVRRILKPGGTATMVVGNSCLKGVFIHNSAAVAKALELQGLTYVSESVRDLPSASRYLPTAAGSSLAKRIRQESVLRWAA